jgi:hypothetical protein
MQLSSTLLPLGRLSLWRCSEGRRCRGSCRLMGTDILERNAVFKIGGWS